MPAKSGPANNAVPGEAAAGLPKPSVADGVGPGSSLPLAARMFLICAGLIALAVAVSLFITWQQGRRIAGETVAQAITTSLGVQQESTQARLDLLETTIQAIAADPAVAGYFEHAVVDSQLGLGEGQDDGQGEAAAGLSLHDLLLERQSEYRFDLGIFLDAEGNVAARSDEVEAVAENMSDDPFLRTSIERAVALSGFWRQDRRLFQAAIVPIARDQNLLGFLLLARAVDGGFARRIGKVSGADIAYVAAADDGPVLFSSSLPEGAAAALTAALAHNPDWQIGGSKPDAGKVRALSLAGRPWIARVRPLDVDAGASLGQSLTLLPVTRAYAGYQKLLNLLALTGLCSLLVALPVSYWLAKRVLRPVTAMAAAASRAAAGDYHSEIRYRGKDEFASLARSFDQLLAELREKSDIEGYVGNLARFLPEPRDEPGARPALAAPSAAPMAAAHWVVLAVECRALQRPVEGASGMPAALGAFSEAVDRLGQGAGCQLVLATGARALFGFSGDAAMASALAAAGQLQEDTDLEAALRAELAFALHAGALVGGRAALAGALVPVAAGATIYQVERLLAEAPVGLVLVAKPLLPVLAGLMAAPVQAGTGVLSGRAYPALPVSALQQLPPLAVGLDVEDRGTRVAPSAVIALAARRGSGETLIGSIFGERYQIVAKLGSGGMGVVYKARDLELDDVVAIKMLRDDARLDAEQLDRLKSELKLARRITHPNVLRTFDFGEHQGRPYLSMEYVRGMTLRYLLQQTSRIPLSAALRIARQLCAGLAAAHQVGVLHRDIKPENLILEQSGNAKLMDFGIARPIRRVEPWHTQPGMFIGTPHYSAPEQLAGEEVDHRADIYAVGVLMCEMFCGRLPYAGANTMEIYMAQMQHEPIRPSHHWAEIPPALEAIILRCLARRAEDRYSSADDLAADLGAVRG